MGNAENVSEITARKASSAALLGKIEKIFILFVIAWMIGWFYELAYYLIAEHRIANHGFFYGPYLPVYGFGALFILLCTSSFKKYPIAVFLLSIPVTGILEYFTGLVMFRIWHARWWDYTTAFMNIGGFVCLRSVLSFGVGALILIYIVDPAVSGITGKLSPRMRNSVSALLLALLIFDIVMTVLFRMPKPFA